MRRGIIAALVALLVVAGALASLMVRASDDAVVLATGVSGGAFETAIGNFATSLSEQGIDVRLTPVAESSTWIDAVQDPESPVNAAFIAMPVQGSKYPDVSNVGTIMRMPVLVLASPEALGPRAEVTDLLGARIQVGARGSMRELSATAILAQYGITAANSTFLHDPQRQALARVESGVDDALIALLDMQDPQVDTLASRSRLTIVEFTQAEALSARTGYTTPLTIPAGAFGLAPVVPSRDIQTVAIPVSLIMKDSVGDGDVYVVARYLSETYGRGSLSGPPGIYPNFNDRQLPPRAAAQEYYDTGRVPWQYGVFPRPLADLLVPLLVLVSGLLVVATVYQVLFPDSLSLWTGILRPRREEKALRQLEEALAAGHDLTPKQRQLLSQILAEQDSERSFRQRAEAMRSQLDEPVHMDEAP